MTTPIYDTKDHGSQSGPSYWPNLTSECILAAGVLDLEFWDMKPWTWPGTIDAVQAPFLKQCVGNDADAAMFQMLEDLDKYMGKRSELRPLTCDHIV